MVAKSASVEKANVITPLRLILNGDDIEEVSNGKMTPLSVPAIGMTMAAAAARAGDGALVMTVAKANAAAILPPNNLNFGRHSLL